MLVTVAFTAAACGGRASPDRPQPVRGSAFADPLEIYDDLGFITGPAQFPVVASLSTLSGPADSSLVLAALSIPNSALRFQREGTGFFAEYDVSLAVFDLDSTIVKRSRRRELVRVPSFNETARTEESVVHQQVLSLLPGRYLVRVDAADANSSRGFTMTDTLDVPAYGGIGVPISSAVLVYEAAGRQAKDEAPALIANPRHTVPYGGAAPRVYVESYTMEPVLAQVRVIDAAGTALWSSTVHWSADSGIRHALIDIPAEVLPLGRFTIEVGDAAMTRQAPLLLAISDQWMVANFDEVLQFMRYIATEAELDSLRVGSPADRRVAWDRFWEARDPLPVTALNEFRETFFERTRYATEAFREVGRPGWNTDRGEVYIVLGPPDGAREVILGERDMTNQADAEEWIYHSVAGNRLTLLFHDRTGFGRYDLVPASAAAFRSAAERLKRMRPGIARSR